MAGLDMLSNDLWSSFVERVQEVIRAGLERLATDTVAFGFGASIENDLNRELFFRLRRIAAAQKADLFAAVPRLALRREHTWNLAPVHEANNQPSPDDPQRTPREDKRPDFQWSFLDDQAEDLDRAARTYVVECKRLGEAIGRWVLNANYVAQGVRRFVDASHLYGKDDSGAGMIGYVQSMAVDTIWAEVAQQLADAGLSALPKPGPHRGSIVLHIASHDLSRSDACSPFRLHHFWVDLRE
jgi:hypothetical protein